jgi:hypothetical protein
MEKQNSVLKRRNEEKAMLEKRLKDNETKQSNAKDQRFTSLVVWCRSLLVLSFFSSLSIS